jgi:lysophospholipase L1-like esterase
MAQILIFGASSPYGVGGSQGGWPDLLKQKLHQQMYDSKTLPIETHEVYNLCVPGATISDIQKRFAIEVECYSKPDREQIIVIMLGGNDAKAQERPDNFVNNPENFYEQMKELVLQAKKYTGKVALVGMKPVDESKTMPKINPQTGGKSYFENKRIGLFDQKLAALAEDTNIAFVPIFGEAQKLEWEFNFDDGLHPNDRGHQWLLEQAWPVLREFL